MRNHLSRLLLTLMFIAPASIFASGDSEENTFNPVDHAMHHILDAHEIHLMGEGDNSVAMPLPVILWTEKGLVMFMSSAFHHDNSGHHIVERNGMSFVKSHEKIYQLNAGAHAAEFDDKGHIVNGVAPLDLSITKNVLTMLVVAFLMFWIFMRTARYYKKNQAKEPRGIAAWMEPVIIFIKGIADESIDESKASRFVPFLLTMFFFILFGNLLGLIPFISNPNMTGSISVCLVLATFTFVIQMFSTRKYYWMHIIHPLHGSGMPVVGMALLYLMLIPIEIVGILVKPFSLMIRLFANITAGHIVIIALVSIIFIFQTAWWGAMSVPMALFISLIEILVVFLQAYIFTMLSALYIGMAVEKPHH